MQPIEDQVADGILLSEEEALRFLDALERPDERTIARLEDLRDRVRREGVLEQSCRDHRDSDLVGDGNCTLRDAPERREAS
jgi:hypothetical protein